MTDPLTEDQFIFDPLSKITRAERRMLLAVSGVGLAVFKVPLIPTKVAILGIEFQANNQVAFLQIYALLIGFFALAFTLYALTDFVAWRRMTSIRIHAYEHAVVRRKVATTVEEQAALKEEQQRRIPFDHGPRATYTGSASWDLAWLSIRLRAFFEFGFPLGFAFYVIVGLIELTGRV